MRAGDSTGRWRRHTRVQESEFDGGVAGRVVGKLVQLWNALLQDACCKHFGSGAPSTAIGQSQLRKWTKCHRRSWTELDNASFGNGTLSIGQFGTGGCAPKPGVGAWADHPSSSTDRTWRSGSRSRMDRSLLVEIEDPKWAETGSMRRHTRVQGFTPIDKRQFKGRFVAETGGKRGGSGQWCEHFEVKVGSLAVGEN